eukprot:5984434-Prymnesium_polylepis.1
MADLVSNSRSSDTCATPSPATSTPPLIPPLIPPRAAPSLPEAGPAVGGSLPPTLEPLCGCCGVCAPLPPPCTPPPCTPPPYTPPPPRLEEREERLARCNAPS